MNERTKTCLQCGEPFEYKSEKARFCSERCKKAHQRGSTTVQSTEEKPMKKVPKKVAKKSGNSIEGLKANMNNPEIWEDVTASAYPVIKPKKKAASSKPSTTPAIEKAMAEINKDYGEGSVMRMDDSYKAHVDVISTGNLAIDNAIGVGGLPRGRVVEIYGPEGSGKTTIACSVVAQAQSMGLKAAYIDVEHSFNRDYARKLGVVVEDLFFSQPDSGVQALRTCQRLTQSGGFGVVVIDSVAALISEQELNGEIGDACVGAVPRLMSQALRLLPPIVRKSNTLCIFINQIREKVGVMYGSPEITPGGRALKFAASVRMNVRKQTAIKDALEEVTGYRTKVEIVKNKVAAPMKIAEFDLIFGEGVGGVGSLIDVAVKHEVVEKKGSWYSYNGEKIGQGREGCKLTLKEDPSLRKEIEAQVRSAMVAPAPAVALQSTEEEEDQIP